MSWIHCSCGGEMAEPTIIQKIGTERYLCPQCEKDHGHMVEDLVEAVDDLCILVEKLSNSGRDGSIAGD